MLGLFRTNQLAANLLLIIYVLVLRVSGLIADQPWEPNSTGVLSNLVYDYVGTHGWLPDLLAMILVLIQAFLLNILSARFRMSKEVTMFPGVFYVLLMSTIPDFLHLSPMLMGNTFLIIALTNMFKTMKATSSADSIFNVGFWISVAGLFYFSNFLFLLFAIFGLSTLRNFKINEFFMVLVGGLVPIFLGGTIAFFNDSLLNFYQVTFFEEFGCLDFIRKAHWSNYVAIGVFGLLVLTGFFSLNIYFQKQNIRSQKMIQVLYYFIIFSILTIFIQKRVGLEQLLLLSIPLALMLPLNFLSFRKKDIGTGLHAVWLIGILFLQYHLLFM